MSCEEGLDLAFGDGAAADDDYVSSGNVGKKRVQRAHGSAIPDEIAVFKVYSDYLRIICGRRTSFNMFGSGFGRWVAWGCRTTYETWC